MFYIFLSCKETRCAKKEKYFHSKYSENIFAENLENANKKIELVVVTTLNKLA